MPPSGEGRAEIVGSHLGDASRSWVSGVLDRRPLALSELAHLILAGTIGAGLLFSLGVAVGIGGAEGLVCLMATAALLAVSLPLVLRGRSELTDPLWLTVSTVAIGVTGKAFYLVLGPPERIDFLLRGRRPEDVLFATVVLAGGMLLLALGYACGALRWRVPGLERLSQDRWEVRKFTAVVGILVVAGLLSFLLFAARLDLSIEGLADLSSKRFLRDSGTTSTRGAAQGYMRWGAMLLEIALYLAFARWAAARRSLRSRAGVGVCLLFLLAVIFPFFVSSRTSLMLIVLRILLIWLCIRGQPRPRLVAVVALLALAVMGSMLALRRGQEDWASLVRHVGVEGILEATVGGRHFLDLSKTAVILDGVPEVLDYRFGGTLVGWLVAPVPRKIWSAKPDVGPGREVGRALFDTPPTSGVPPGLVGDLHLNFGLPGVALGLLGLGLLLRSLYETFRPHLPNKAIVVVFVLLSTRLALDLPGVSVAATATKLVMEFLPLTLALIALTSRRRSSSPVRRAASRAPVGAGRRAAARGAGSREQRQRPRSGR